MSNELSWGDENEISWLEARIASNVTHSKSGRWHTIEANCTNAIGIGLSVTEAINDFVRNYGLKGE